MQLTPIAPEALGDALDAFGRGIANDPLATAAFVRIRRSIGSGRSERALADAALSVAARLGIPTLDEEPARAFSWDGERLRVRSEACVLFHEIAHWQIALRERRMLADFGLGAGPETGRKAEADRARVVGEERRIVEECEASLLGILWEAASNGPAIEAFLEQNWLERFACDGTHSLFTATLAGLFARGLIDRNAAPVAAEGSNAGRDGGSHHAVVTAA
jgi:hypothetical protein